jgi:hypothetical protein
MSIREINFIYERSCLSKSNLSLERANQLVDYHAKNNNVIYYYKCGFCNSYHLSKKSPSEVIFGQNLQIQLQRELK